MLHFTGSRVPRQRLKSFPTTETGGKHGMFGVGGVYLNVEHPVQRATSV